MKKVLPKVKKAFVSFMQEEDAKLVSKTATKVMLASSVFLVGCGGGGGGANIASHANVITLPEHVANSDNFPEGYKFNVPSDRLTSFENRNEIHQNPSLVNYGEQERPSSINNLPYGKEGYRGYDRVTVEPKTVKAHHANHYNHYNR
jgi:hypothetical protein